MSEQSAENDAEEARRLVALAESHSWYEGDGDLPRVKAILAAAQVYATLASRFPSMEKCPAPCLLCASPCPRDPSVITPTNGGAS